MSGYCEIRLNRAITLEDIEGFYSIKGELLSCPDEDAET